MGDCLPAGHPDAGEGGGDCLPARHADAGEGGGDCLPAGHPDAGEGRGEGERGQSLGRKLLPAHQATDQVLKVRDDRS